LVFIIFSLSLVFNKVSINNISCFHFIILYIYVARLSTFTRTRQHLQDDRLSKILQDLSSTFKTLFTARSSKSHLQALVRFSKILSWQKVLVRLSKIHVWLDRARYSLQDRARLSKIVYPKSSKIKQDEARLSEIKQD
jgi:hypothetical protein